MTSAEQFVPTLEKWIELFMRHSMHNFIRYSRESGISMSQIGVLFHIHRIGCIGITDLGEDMGVTSAAASQISERLVQQGLIQRSEDPQDRRVRQIVLTEQGRQMLQESIHARQEWLNDLAENLSTDEKEQIMTAFNILIDKIHQLTPQT
jgi:DNA-binding MarR family transcriptional regulator